MDPVTVIMRSRNDMPLVAETLAMVRRQTVPVRLVNLDNASTDGTREVVEQYTDCLVEVPAGRYVPGRVLNEGMRHAESELVAFLNSDCTPLDEHWLERLLAAFTDDTAAVFGRQLPRPGCWPIHARDTEDTYGDGRRQASWRHCFSMASSAIRRSVWAEMPFDESLQYSEDIAWTWSVRQRGWQVRYAPESRVYHSHNYRLGQFYRRHYGEGRAEAVIFDWRPWERSLLRYTLLPLARQVVDDWRWCLRHGAWQWLPAAPALRVAQALGRRKGFREGWRERRRREAA